MWDAPETINRNRTDFMTIKKQPKRKAAARSTLAGGFGPSPSTIRRRLRELRKLIDDPHTDNLTARVAYESEQMIRWATEKTVGWPSPADSARETALMIREGI